MSQAGSLNSGSNNPGVPTAFVTNSGAAVPALGVLQILGADGITTSAVGNTVTIAPSMLSVTSPLINFTVLGLTTIFTTSATRSFVASAISVACILATAPDQGSVFSVGWTPAAYTNLIFSANPSVSTTNQTITLGSLQGNLGALIPPGTVVKLNVSTADGGTALQCRVTLIGYYI